MKILKNKHYETPFPFPKFYFGDTIMETTCKFTFTESCKYDIDKDQNDINKLFGFGYGYHHNISDRVGWRYDPELDQIELLTYIYNNKKRKSRHIAWVNIDDSVVITVKPQLDYRTGKLTTKFIIKSNDCSIEIMAYKQLSGFSKWFKYSLGGYFGGNRKAPHNIYL